MPSPVCRRSPVPNCASLIAGVFPGHHGIMGNSWFDRWTLTLQNYVSFETYLNVNDDLRSPTLYELLATSSRSTFRTTRGAV